MIMWRSDAIKATIIQPEENRMYGCNVEIPDVSRYFPRANT
jgi:hypothetical protein